MMKNPYSRRSAKIRRIAFYSTLTAVPIGVGLLVGRRSRLAGAVAGGLTALGLGAIRWQLARLFSDEPAYEVEEHIGPLEVRRYAAHVAAHTDIDDDNYDSALNAGFRRLARYIFGDNFRGERLEMTTPVTSRSKRAAASEKLDMTAPVITAPAEHGYRMSFVMPPGRDIASLPTPNDSAIELDEVPERRVAVLRFRGRYNGSAVEQRERELMKLVEDAGLAAAGAPMFAGFDAPATIPLLRRNEVWVELSDGIR
jgi:hypothetical protein